MADDLAGKPMTCVKGCRLLHHGVLRHGLLPRQRLSVTIPTNERFAYVRLVGNHAAEIDQRTITIDRGEDLARWADKVMAFRRRTNGDVYVLLNNHYAGFSAGALRELQRILGLPVVSFETPPTPEADEIAVGEVDGGVIVQPRLL